jgi:ornithine cyclodeaminase/alanine dehydrogenase-like protein (mu-crystallin family)
MIRYLSERDVERLLPMDATIGLVESSLKARAEGRAFDVPRVRAHVPTGTLHMVEAAAPELGVIGYKAYFALNGKGARYFVHLFDTGTGKPTAMIEGSHLGMQRTGAASGVATRHLARADAAVVASIGAGKQAVGQLEAVCAVRKIREARVWSRNPERARQFCAAMEKKLGMPVRAVADPAETVRGADIINVITKAATPVLLGAWLSPGQHINAAGSNSLARRELDEAAVRRATRIVVDSRNTARNECGDLLPLVETGFANWDALPEIGEIIAGRAAGRAGAGDITLYESHGMAIQDLYAAKFVLDAALAQNVGVDLPVGD